MLDNKAIQKDCAYLINKAQTQRKPSKTGLKKSRLLFKFHICYCPKCSSTTESNYVGISGQVQGEAGWNNISEVKVKKEKKDSIAYVTKKLYTSPAGVAYEPEV